METAGLISTRHLFKIYTSGDEELYALNDVSLDVNQRDYIAIMGASGSGKSTFMNILGCLDAPTRGEYLFDGILLTGKSRTELAHIRRDHMGFVFQSFNLLPRTTAFDNVELPLIYCSSITRGQRREKVEQALISVGLKERMYHLPNKLSGGQQQRVAIARAIVNDPAVILADEPTGNLDTRTSMEIIQIFQRLNEQGKTIVMVTHEVDIGASARKRVVFKDGKIITEELITNRLIASTVLVEMKKPEQQPSN